MGPQWQKYLLLKPFATCLTICKQWQAPIGHCQYSWTSLQDDPKAAEGLALASTALESAMPLVAEVEEAQKAAEAARSEFNNVSR